MKKYGNDDEHLIPDEVHDPENEHGLLLAVDIVAFVELSEDLHHCFVFKLHPISEQENHTKNWEEAENWTNYDRQDRIGKSPVVIAR